MLRNALTINDRYRLQLAGVQAHAGEARSSLSNPEQWLIDFFTGGKTTSGQPVNDSSALGLAAVYACCRVLSDSIASLPIALYRNLPGGGSEPATDRIENNLVGKSPSPLYTSFSFRSAMQLHLGLRGNAYAEIVRKAGVPNELILIQPSLVTPVLHSGKLVYSIAASASQKQKILLPHEILHIASLGFDGISGISPIQTLRETIGMGLANRDNQSKTLSRGRVDGLLRHPSKLTTDQVNALTENFANRVNAGRFPLLENGVEYQSISLSPEDVQFINTAKLTRQDIAGAYRIPPHMIGDLERATFSNIEQQSIEFVKFSLMPWLKAWEAELDRKLLSDNLKEDHFFRFNVDGLLRGDIQTRMRAMSMAIQWGIMNRDEARELENRNPIPGGLGQEFLTPLNMSALSDQNGEQSSDNNTDNGARQANSN